MRGVNTLHFNKATVMEAMEEYLNKRALGTAQVQVNTIAFGGGVDFELKVWVEPKKETPK